MCFVVLSLKGGKKEYQNRALRCFKREMLFKCIMCMKEEFISSQ